MYRRLTLIGLTAAIATVLGSAGAVAVPSSTSGLRSEIDQTIALHGGTQTAAGEVTWNDGAVKLAFVDASNAAADVEHCSSGYFCFYQHRDFNFHGGREVGRVLAFRDCGKQSFEKYGFRNMTSSWVNTTGKTIRVYDYAPGADNRLWTEDPKDRSPYVGDNDNDRADYFVAC